MNTAEQRGGAVRLVRPSVPAGAGMPATPRKPFQHFISATRAAARTREEIPPHRSPHVSIASSLVPPLLLCHTPVRASALLLSLSVAKGAATDAARQTTLPADANLERPFFAGQFLIRSVNTESGSSGALLSWCWRSQARARARQSPPEPVGSVRK